MSSPLRVLSFGIPSERPEYPRHRNLLANLQEGGAEVLTCHTSVAAGFNDRFRAATSVKHRAGFLVGVVQSYYTLFREFRHLPRSDVILVGYPGVFHVHLARWLASGQHPQPLIVLDVFLSLYDTVVHDRKILGQNGLPARALRWIEGRAFAAADLCLIDTHAHAAFLAAEFLLPLHKVLPVPVGPSFPPAAAPVEPDGAKPGLSVVFVGTYIPLHGIEVILGAAQQLRARPEIQFTLVGGGQLRPAMEGLARERDLTNVVFRDWVPTVSLRDLLRGHDVALGIFGRTEKAMRVVPIKAYDVCAAGIPLVTADTPAARELLEDGDNALLVPSGDPTALADALRRLQGDPVLRRQLARGAHELALGLPGRGALVTLLASACRGRSRRSATSRP